MPIDDAFQRRLRDIAARFHDWSLPLKNDANFDVDDRNGYWRFAGRPYLANACTFEVLVHPSSQVDFFVAAQAYEERNLEPFERILPLVKAIADGYVITRSWRSQNTAAISQIETIITLDDATVWRDCNKIATIADTSHLLMQHQDRHYVPYKR